MEEGEWKWGGEDLLFLEQRGGGWRTREVLSDDE